MSETLFYTAPSDILFDEMQELAMDIWSTYDDTHGYASEKMNYVSSLKNIQSNFMTIYQMFDHINQQKLLRNASDDLISAINERD